MVIRSFSAAAATVVMTALMFDSGFAADQKTPGRAHFSSKPKTTVRAQSPSPVQPAFELQAPGQSSQVVPAGDWHGTRSPRHATRYLAPPYENTSTEGNYPQLDAPLYPSPLQRAPGYTGGSIITNQALAPHEMLYAHEYRAMYPPFYYKVKGHWLWTPLGIRTHERWKLQGTEVRVKYRSHIKPFTGFIPPNAWAH